MPRPHYTGSMSGLFDGFARHFATCNNAILPGSRLPFSVAGQEVGFVTPALAQWLGGTAVAAAELPALGWRMAEAGLCQWRAEAFDVRPQAAGPSLATIDRGALPLLGIEGVGVHLHGVVPRRDGLSLWVGRRAANKKLDPGKLDHIVAGGVAAGLSVAETLRKEAEEEAGLPASLVKGATYCGTIQYAMERPEGLRRDRLHCYDLHLPESFVPHPVDGEVASFELWPMAKVIQTVRDTDHFKFNVNLVLIDLFVRLGLVQHAMSGKP